MVYTSPVATAGTGLQGVQPAISVVSFGPEEVHAGKCVVSLYGSEEAYPPDVEVLPEPVSEPNDELSEDNKAVSVASKSEQSSSEDSSKDSSSDGGSSSSSSEEESPKLKVKPKRKHACSGEASGDSEEDAPTKKKKRVKAKSDEGSDGEKAKADPPGDKNSSSGFGGSGRGDSGSNGGRGSAPNPGWPFPNLPMMDMLEKLGNDLYKYSKELFNNLEQTSMKVYDKVFNGFQDTGSITRNFCCKVTAIAINFFHEVEQLEENLESVDQVRFKIALNKMREQITEMMERAAQAEIVYKEGTKNFETILQNLTVNIKEFVETAGKTQYQEYQKRCYSRIREDHGALDGTQFIPVVVSNLVTHKALRMSHRITQTKIPLQIMMSPMLTQADVASAQIKFLEVMMKRMVALEQKLGPGIAASINLESEGAQTTLAVGAGAGGAATNSGNLPGRKKDSLLQAPLPGSSKDTTPSKHDHPYSSLNRSSIQSPMLDQAVSFMALFKEESSGKKWDPAAIKGPVGLEAQDDDDQRAPQKVKKHKDKASDGEARQSTSKSKGKSEVKAAKTKQRRRRRRKRTRKKRRKKLTKRVRNRLPNLPNLLLVPKATAPNRTAP